MTFYSGKLGFVKVATVLYNFDKWHMNVTAHVPNVTNFGSSGCQQMLSSGSDPTLTGGVSKATLTIEGPYDVGGMGMSVNITYSFQLGIVSGTFFTVPATVTAIDVRDDVNGNPMLSVTAESNGVITPTIT